MAFNTIMRLTGVNCKCFAQSQHNLSSLLTPALSSTAFYILGGSKCRPIENGGDWRMPALLKKAGLAHLEPGNEVMR